MSVDHLMYLTIMQVDHGLLYRDLLERSAKIYPFVTVGNRSVNIATFERFSRDALAVDVEHNFV